jgi:trimeric autotransporter adhesin
MTKLKIVFSFLLNAIAATSLAQVEQVTENQAGISKRLQQEIDMTKDPNLGYVPKSRLTDAYKTRAERIKQNNMASLFSWTERGPNSDAVGASNGNSRPGNGKTSGRVRAIWEDLGDATGKTVWVGGIDGGLWKTTDITLNPATWTPINDFFGNLAIASICQDPTDVNIMYFGTGEKAINADAVRGAGIWRSTDHGVTWAVMAGTANFWNVSKLVCDASGNLYVGCNSISNTSGIQRFTKATSTWTNITPTGLDPRVPDIELSSTGRLHITCGYYNTAAASSGYRYTDNPATVSSATWTSPATTFPTQYNVDLASNGNTLYALASTAAFEVTTIYKSTNGGANWAATGATPAFTSGQAWYCMAVAVDPANANNVIVGSLDCYKTTNGGTSWTKISEWVGTTGQYVHADQQIITWRSNNQVLFGCDGGVHYSANGGTTITDRNQGLRIKQFYAVANHPTSTNYFLAGAQDNGVHQLNNATIGASVEVTGGDGAFVHIDQNEGQYQWGSYVYNQYRRSTNSGSTWTSVNYSSSAGRFINPTDYDDVNNIMYASGVANAFVRWSNPQTGSTFTSVTMSGLSSGKVSAIKVSPYTNHTVFFAGGGSGITPSLIKATAANATPAFTSIIGTGMTTASANISCIELGTTEQNIIVAFSNYGISNVWVTSNGGTTWTAIDGNLPDMPVRWAMFYPGDNSKAIIATETGIWQTSLINSAATAWDPETGFPNVRTDMLQYRASDGLLSAATHGRGLFTTIIGAAPSCGTVTGLATSAITSTTATVSWAALSGALNYDVDYKLNSSGTWTNAATATTSLSVALSDLTESSLYDYRVRANCTGATGAYTQAQFTTASPVTCNVPTGLTASSITTTSATVNWAAASGASSYIVDYKAASSGTWLNVATTNLTSQPISGLASGTLYDWRVRTNCAAGTSANATAQFTTTAVVTCPGPLDVSTNGNAAGASTIPFNTDVKGLISPTGDNDYYKFVITTGGTATITLTTLPFDYDVKLYSSNGTTQLAISQNGGTTSETISRTYTAGTYYVHVYGYSGANSASSCYTLKVQLGTATIQELPVTQSDTKVKLFPNPVSSKLSVYLVGDNNRKDLKLYDVNGKLVYTQQLNDMFTTLDLQKLSKGVYFIKIIQADGSLLYSEKVVKD